MPSSEASSRPKLIHDAIWVVGCRVVGIASTLVSNLLVARLLGPDGFGVFFLITTILALGSLLSMGGLGDAGLRFVSENLGLNRIRVALAYMNRTLKQALVGSSIVALLTIVGLLFFRHFFQRDEITSVAVASTGLGVLTLAWQQIAAQMLRSLNNLRSASFYSGGQTGGPISNLLFLCPLVVAQIWSIPLTITHVIAFLVGSIFLTMPFAFWDLFRDRHNFAALDTESTYQLTTPERKEFAKVARSLLGIQSLAFVASQSDIMIGNAMLTPQEIGYYSAAKRVQLIAHMPLQMASMTIQSSIPRLFARGELAELENRIRTAASLAAVPALIGLMAFIIFPAQALDLLFGEEFREASNIVRALSVGVLALIFFGNPRDTLAITGNHQLVLYSKAVAAIILLVFGTVGSYLAGPLGLAIGSSMALILKDATLWWMARKHVGIWTHLRVRIRGIQTETNCPIPNSQEKNS